MKKICRKYRTVILCEKELLCGRTGKRSYTAGCPEQFRDTFHNDGDYPLVDWGIAEEDALKICYAYGFDFGGLYEIYNRASCWCCPFQRIGGLRKMRSHHPELWEKLLQLDWRARQQFGTDNPLGRFRKNWTVEQLERKFCLEERLGRMY